MSAQSTMSGLSKNLEAKGDPIVRCEDLRPTPSSVSQIWHRWRGITFHEHHQAIWYVERLKYRS
jgi:hypothetical protein